MKSFISEHKQGLLMILAAFLFFGANIAFSGENHHAIVVVPQEPVEAPVYINTSSETIINNTTGTVLGVAASQCHLTQSHHLMQWCIGGANYQNKNAINFEVGQKFSNTLINISIGFEEGKANFNEAAIGFGASGTF